ncbi:MAG: hypothetical protein ACI9JN_001616 [Bacteroidia bacterium]|jgi:hypothetical protein
MTKEIVIIAYISVVVVYMPIVCFLIKKWYFVDVLASYSDTKKTVIDHKPVVLDFDIHDSNCHVTIKNCSSKDITINISRH